MKAILLIGGLGTRLRPLTLTTPKPLLPILDQPFIAYQLDFLRRHGIRDVILCTSYRAEAFHRAIGDGKRYGVKLRYVHENAPLGTGGAIKNAESCIDEATLICNGDILMDLNLRELIDFHQHQRAVATIALTRVEDPTAFGLIVTDTNGRIRQFIEKPTPEEVIADTINAGVYIFEKEVFSLIPKGVVYSVERGLFPKLLELHKPLFGKFLPGYWLDVGTLEKYRQAQHDVQDGRYPHRPMVKKTKVRKESVR